ncbi:hypothetical protein RIR_jg6573.t1 [Rhizophagus irregularis DAOM 181602=DAOM 197198]|nr:hypothetical protein RIR_jg6573.t1 [Rhizophagus irregularis DAOM 181602=DAOM 197198]
MFSQKASVRPFGIAWYSTFFTLGNKKVIEIEEVIEVEEVEEEVEVIVEHSQQQELRQEDTWNLRGQESQENYNNESSGLAISFVAETRDLKCETRISSCMTL